MENLNNVIIKGKDCLLALADHFSMYDLPIKDLNLEAMEILISVENAKDSSKIFSKKVLCEKVEASIIAGNYKEDIVSRFKDEIDWDKIKVSLTKIPKDLNKYCPSTEISLLNLKKILKDSKVTEDFIVNHIEMIDNNDLWGYVSTQMLSDEFMDKYKDKLDFKVISNNNSDLSPYIVRKYINRLSFYGLCSYWKHWSNNIDIINENWEAIKKEWYSFCSNEYLSKETVFMYKDDWCWESESLYYNRSKNPDFFLCFLDYVNIIYLQKKVALNYNVKRALLLKYKKALESLKMMNLDINIFLHDIEKFKFDNIVECGSCSEDSYYEVLSTEEAINRLNHYNVAEKKAINDYYRYNLIYRDSYADEYYLEFNEELLKEFSDIIDWKAITKIRISNEYFLEKFDCFDMKNLRLESLLRLSFESIYKILEKDNNKDIINYLYRFNFSIEEVESLIQLYIDLGREISSFYSLINHNNGKFNFLNKKYFNI